MPRIHAALSFNPDAGLIQAGLPLFQGEEVDALEWSFDTLFKLPEVPEWFEELLAFYGDHGRLVGHGVFFSLFSGKWLPEQAAWLDQLRALSKRYPFDHISEHFGFLTGSDFHKGAPLAVPYSQQTLAIGRDRLLRIADACGCPVGLENLAFAMDIRAAQVHGEFLDALLEPVNGFLILDLHNLYCQLHNFDLDAEAMLATIPLQRVREVHISGGSWQPSSFRPEPGIRRDTHDEQVPEEVFELLSLAMPHLPNLKLVVMEQMGFTLHTPEAQAGYQADYRRMREMVQQEDARRDRGENSPFIPPSIGMLPLPLEDMELHQQQRALSDILETADSLESALAAIASSPLAGTDWDAHAWDPAMLETARLIAQKWRDRN